MRRSPPQKAVETVRSPFGAKRAGDASQVPFSGSSQSQSGEHNRHEADIASDIADVRKAAMVWEKSRAGEKRN
jgi:hypothetical protein